MARQVKQCPKCMAMTFLETEQCHHCGHLFRTDVAASAPTSFNPERTQMLTLPALFPRAADAEQEAPTIDSLKFLEPISPRRRSPLPLVGILTIVVLLLVTFVWLLMH